jgi:hypothetical protein
MCKGYSLPAQFRHIEHVSHVAFSAPAHCHYSRPPQQTIATENILFIVYTHLMILR